MESANYLYFLSRLACLCPLFQSTELMQNGIVSVNKVLVGGEVSGIVNGHCATHMQDQ